MSVKSKREEVIDFAFPYYRSGLVIMVRADNKDINTIDDFPGKIVATKQGTSTVDFLKSEGVTPKLKELKIATKQGTSTVDFLKSEGLTPKLKELKKFPNISDAFMELTAGGCDAVLFDLR